MWGIQKEQFPVNSKALMDSASMYDGLRDYWINVKLGQIKVLRIKAIRQGQRDQNRSDQNQFYLSTMGSFPIEKATKLGN